MKKTLILLFSFLFIWTSTFPVKASEIQPIDSTDIIEVFDDGSYIESFTEENIKLYKIIYIYYMPFQYF